MRQYLTMIYVCLATCSYGQDFVFDTTAIIPNGGSRRYYEKTDFSFIDSVELWRYSLDTTFRGQSADTVKPLGRILFWRSSTIRDSLNKLVYKHLWMPYIEFNIFTIDDSSYCRATSMSSRFLSSCVAPNVGGDVIIINKFIFLNRHVCLDCQRYETKIDYCRPVINYIFSRIDKSKTETINDLVNQFVIPAENLRRRNTY